MINIQITTSVISNIKGILFGQKLLVCPFMNGSFSEKPPLPSKYDVMWNRQKVLKYLDNLGPIELLIIKGLTLKISRLIILMSQKRFETHSEADVFKCSTNYVFLKFLQISQENTCVRVYF